MSEAFAHANRYTEEDYYNLPENVRAEPVPKMSPNSRHKHNTSDSI